MRSLAVALLVFGGVAMADSFTVGHATVSWVQETTPAGNDAYTLSLSSTVSSDEAMTALDALIEGPLNQVKTPGGDWTPTLGDGRDVEDSHYLIPTLDDTGFFATWEGRTLIVVPQALAEDGTSMAAAYGFQPGVYNDNPLTWGRVVVPAGESFDVTLKCADGTGQVWSNEDTVAGGELPASSYNVFFGTFTVPEPTSLGLLALGGLAVLRRRRR
jgi:hypothetical protein